MHEHQPNFNGSVVGSLLTISFAMLSYAGNQVDKAGLMLNTCFTPELLQKCQTLAAMAAILTCVVTCTVTIYNTFFKKK